MQPGASGGRSGALTTSGVIAIVISALWALFALIMFIVAITIDELTDDDDFAGIDDLGDAAAGVFFAIGIVILAAVVWSIIAAAKMLQRRSWGRVATIVNFSIWGVLTLLFAIGSLAGSSDDPDTVTIDEESEGDAGSALLWFVHVGGCVAVVACAAQRSVGESIRAHESRLMGGTYGFGAPPPFYGAPPQAQPNYGAPPQAQPTYSPPPSYGGTEPTYAEPSRPESPPYAPPNAEPPSPPPAAPPLPPEPGPPDQPPPPPPPPWGAPPR